MVPPADNCMTEQTVFDQEELSYWLAFSQMRGLKLKYDHFNNILDRFENLTNLWSASKAELLESRLFNQEILENFFDQKRKADPEKLLQTVLEKNITALPYSHPNYPLGLRHIHDPPMVLYINGSLMPHQFLSPLAIVGTRKPTTYGRTVAKLFSKELASAGATIISGMAIGIDSLCHWGALEGGGKTVAVLACGVDQCYPSSNRPLFEKLTNEDVGCVVSEYFPGTKPEKWRFPARNRIISGLCEGLLVVEAAESSGALISANLAFGQSRNVYAIPGRINNEMSKGTNDLIYRQVAHLVTTPMQLIEAMNWVVSKKDSKQASVVELFGREKEVYDFLTDEPVHFDFICSEIGMPAGELSGTLTILELAGIIERHPGEWFSKSS